MQRDLFDFEYHAIFVRRDGEKSLLMFFNSHQDMLGVIDAKLKLYKKDKLGEWLAYVMLCQRVFDARGFKKIIKLDTIFPET